MKAGDLKRVHSSLLVKTALVQYLNCLLLPNYYKQWINSTMHTEFTCLLAIPGGNPILSVGDFMIT